MRFKTVGALCIVAFMALASAVQAGCGSSSCCMCGKKVCVLEVSKEKEDVLCFDVESKEICIPGIKLPWECKRRCGGVRTVCVLTEVKKEKTVCKYDWSLKVICTSCCKRHGLKHSAKQCADVQKDARVPFEYYTADLAPENVVAEEGLTSEMKATMVARVAPSPEPSNPVQLASTVSAAAPAPIVQAPPAEAVLAPLIQAPAPIISSSELNAGTSSRQTIR